MKIVMHCAVLLVLLAAGSQSPAAQKRKTGAQTASEGRRLAVIGKTAITEIQARTEAAEDLEALELQILKQKAVAARKEHELLEEALNRIIERNLLQAEAKKRNTSEEALLAEIRQKVPEPSPREIDAFYEENKHRITVPREQVEPRIAEYLREQEEKRQRKAFFDRLESEYRVTRYLEPLRQEIAEAGRPAAGPASAPVRLVLFSDFQCPYCRDYSNTLKQVLKKYDGKVRLVFRQFPLTEIHPYAQRAAEAALCADAQGRFWEMHDLLLQNQKSLEDEDLKDRAAKLKLDAAAFDTCLEDARVEKLVQQDIRDGMTAGVEGTPALFINGRFLNGNRPFQDIAEIIDDELKRWR